MLQWTNIRNNNSRYRCMYVIFMYYVEFSPRKKRCLSHTIFSTDLKRNIYKTSNGLDISIYYKHQKIFIYFFVFKTMFLKHAIFGILLHYKTSKV